MKDNNLKKEYELLLNAQNDKTHFAQLYTYFVDDVYRFCYSILNNRHDAEDVTSQVFTEFYRKISEYKWKNISVKYWFFTVARNICYSKFRKAKEVQYDEVLHGNNDGDISFVEEIMNKEIVDKIKEEILKLSPEEQEVINLRIWEELQFAQIAELQNQKENTCKVRFYRAIDKVKKSLDKQNYAYAITVPGIFTAIKDVGSLPLYQASDQLIASGASIVVGKTIMDTITSILASIKESVTTHAVAATTITTTAVVATTGFVTYHTYTPQKRNPLESPAQMVLYKDEETRIAFNYPSDYTVKKIDRKNDQGAIDYIVTADDAWEWKGEEPLPTESSNLRITLGYRNTDIEVCKPYSSFESSYSYVTLPNGQQAARSFGRSMGGFSYYSSFTKPVDNDSTDGETPILIHPCEFPVKLPEVTSWTVKLLHLPTFLSTDLGKTAESIRSLDEAITTPALTVTPTATATSTPTATVSPTPSIPLVRKVDTKIAVFGSDQPLVHNTTLELRGDETLVTDSPRKGMLEIRKADTPIMTLRSFQEYTPKRWTEVTDLGRAPIGSDFFLVRDESGRHFYITQVPTNSDCVFGSGPVIKSPCSSPAFFRQAPGGGYEVYLEVELLDRGQLERTNQIIRTMNIANASKP